MLKVAKFGGSSMADAGQYRKVRDILLADPERRVVIVSAAGKRNSNDHKLTDLLYLCHAHTQYGVACDPIFEMITSRYLEVRDELGLDLDLESEFAELKKQLDAKTITQDALVSRGEYFSAKLMAAFLGFQFVDAADWIKFNMDGSVDQETSYAALKSMVHGEGIVTPGFYGTMPNGAIRTFSRGGSDITGALAAAALDADVYENWTDVSGILMADPRIVKDPKPIPRITYAELRELAFMGASVLHEESVLPVKEKGIALNIRNTNRPEDEGTMIVEKVEKEDRHERFITGIAGRRNFTIITVLKRNMNTSETLRRALEILDRYKAPVEHITLGLDSFALVTSSAALGDGVYNVLSDIQKSCHPDDVQVKDGIALVAAVGRKMTFRPGISGRLFKALGEHGVNIRTIAQGADELSIIIGVENKHFETAIQVMYDGFAG